MLGQICEATIGEVCVRFRIHDTVRGFVIYAEDVQLR